MWFSFDLNPLAKSIDPCFTLISQRLVAFFSSCSYSFKKDEIAYWQALVDHKLAMFICI